jgi:hypothetical protein
MPDDERAEDDEHVVNYVFPVEVLVVGGLSDADRDAIESQVWESFTDAMTRTA